MADIDDDEDVDKCCGITQPTLLDQIKTILDDYRNDVQIIKELVQNADDAGASEMKILYVESEVNEDEVQNGNVLKGPALVVYNDAKFTELDWKGITSIYSSVKRNDPLKVGRFGLGFKSVFHMTDNPCIISDNYILFINPLEKNDKNVCVQVKLKDLKKSKRLNFHGIMNALNGIFGFSESTITEGIYNGTLFWFSLRQQNSDLSSDIYNREQVNGILEAFSEESRRSLIFLKTLCKVEVFVLSDSCESPSPKRRRRSSKGSQSNLDYAKSKCVVSTSIYNTDASERKSLIAKRKDTLSKIEEIGMSIPNKPNFWKFDVIIETTTSLTSDQVKTTKSRWFIILYLKGEPISSETKSLLKEKDLQYSPLVGLAAPINETGDYTGIISHVFCYQPLPQENPYGTRIPVYVNAFFALGQNRRQIRWPNIDDKGKEIDTDDIKIKWNKTLRTEFLPYAYVQLCNELVNLSMKMKNKENFIQSVYNAVPDVKLIEGHWTHLAKEVINLMEREPIIYTEAKDGVWIKPSEAIFIDQNEFSKLGKEAQSTVYTLLKKDKRNVSCVPEKVMHSLREIYPDKLVFVTPRLLKQHLNQNDSYIALKYAEKLHLMKFILQDEANDILGNLKLLPLANNSFTSFSGARVFLENPDEVKLFPGKEVNFVTENLDEVTKQKLSQLVDRGEYSVNYMDAKDTRKLLKEIIEEHLDKEHLDKEHTYYVAKEEWLRKVWLLIQERCKNQIDLFCDLRLFPIFTSLTKDPKVIPINSLIYILPGHIEKSITELFGFLSVFVIQEVPRWFAESLTEKYFYKDTTKDLQSLFEKIPDTDINEFNKHICKSKSRKLLQFLSDRLNITSQTIAHKLKKMKMFLGGRQLNDSSLRCIAECQKVYNGTGLPIPFPVEAIFLKTENEIRFSKSIGGQVISEDEMVLTALRNLGSNSLSEKDEFIKWVLQKSFLDRPEVLELLKSESFIPTNDGQLHKATELYDPEDDILAALLSKVDKFPSKEYKMYINALKKLGLKTIENISLSDIYFICTVIDRIGIQDVDLRHHKKQYVAFRNEVLERFSTSLEKEKLWNKRCIITHDTELFCPADLISSKYRRLIETEMSVIDNCSECPQLSMLFGWEDQPSVERVIKHFRNIVNKYRTDSISATDILPSVRDIYCYLSKQEIDSTRLLQEHLQNAYIWTGDRFETPAHVYVESSDSDIDLRPFFYQLPKEFLPYKAFFCKNGCKLKIDAEMYLQTLGKIYETDVKQEKRCSDTKLIKMAIDILIKVHDDHLDYALSSELAIYFPVQNKQNNLLMKPAKECTYCDAEWLKGIDFDENEEVNYVHEKVPEYIAEGLCVPSLRQQMLSESDAFEEWGQEEPLTRRLRNLLADDYVDGFSVAKELVQNADDAGANCLKIMYDDRENDGLKTQLLSENMAELQGPAIWVYNDARFTEADFKNITQISGATKKSDSSTIGRFGLGFCSVYNMTDVPCLLSGSSLVMFDPHTTFLGRALPGKSPGLRINFELERNKKLLKRLKNQFKPYDNIFECQLTGTNTAFFNGTLFRLPLRNRASDISDTVYTKSKVQSLFDTIIKCSSNMLIFSQNVQKIELYYLNTKKSNDLKHDLMFSTSKQVLRSECAIKLSSSILKKASEMKENGNIDSQPLNVLEEIKIQTESKKIKGSIFDKVKGKTQEFSWLVSWATGNKQKTMEITRNEKGALPLGAVAVPVKRNNHSYVITSLDQLPDCFYKEGHFFFFLPLPIFHHFQFQINGQFEVRSDRQSLSVSTEGQKNVVKKEWNECIMDDAVTKALLHLLVELRKFVDMTKYNFLQLWPMNKEPVSDWATRSFYRHIMDEKSYPVFYKNDKWFDFSKCMFLEKNFRRSKVGDVAFKAFDTLSASDVIKVVDISDSIYDLLQETDHELFESKTIHCESFYRDYFLPNINQFYKNKFMRDSLIIYALDANIEEINNQLKMIPCIPCKPNETLRRPSQVVDERAFSKLFDDTDEVFPVESFSGTTTLNDLRKLGMMHDSLTNEMVLFSANSVTHLHKQCSECAIDRSLNLILYLNNRLDSHDCILKQLQSIEFMPIATKPKKWPFKWKSDDFETEVEAKGCSKTRKHKNVKNIFRKTIELYHSKNMYLVGSSSLILSCEISEKISDDLAKALGIYLKCDLETVMQQLILMSKTYDATDPESATARFDDIYKYLNWENIQNENLKQEKIVWVSNSLRYPSQVSISEYGDCSPYLFSLKDSPLKKYVTLCKSLSIEISFPASKYAQTLQEIKKTCGENPLEDVQVKTVLNILTCLAKAHVWRDFDTEIYGPDECCILCDCKTMCFNDYDNIEKSETMRYSHPDMPMSLARKLGVKPKLTHSIDENSEDIEDFYQDEPLVVRIQNLIKGYPCDTGIFKELIQNADDAQASEIHFLIDFDTHSSGGVMDCSHSKLQGPSLCVFNNSAFSNDDLDGIKRLGRGNKSEDSFKTGRYGVGFNAVYNLTDVPSFLTWGGDIEKNGESLCFFDPMGCFIPGVTKAKPGRRFKDVATIRKHKSNVIKGYHEIFFKKHSERTGSVFRLPLRTKELANKSEITQEAVDPDKVLNLLKALMTELKHIVLFLKHLFTVRITFHKDDNYTELYAINRHFTEQKRFQNFIKKQKEISKTVAQNPEEMLNIEYGIEIFTLAITDSYNQRNDFIISNSIGFKYANELPQVLRDIIKNGKACIFPIGAVALNKCESEENKAFCFLPLPITTCLPVHVHGYFALDNEARRTLWYDEKENTCYRTQWNVELIEQTIAPAYASLLNFVKEDMLHVHSVSSVMDLNEVSSYLREYLSILPSDNKTSHKYWKILKHAVYKELVKQEASFLPILTSFEKKIGFRSVVSGALNWTTLKTNEQTFPAYRNDDCHFSKETNVFPDLELLRDIGLRSVTLYSDIQYTMKNAGCPIETLSEGHLIRFLASFQDQNLDRCRIEVNTKIGKTVLRNKWNVKKLLRYCLHDQITFGDHLFTIPLFLTLDGILRVLPETEYIFVEGNPNFCNFFPTVRERFLEYEICHGLDSYFDVSKGKLKPFGLKSFADLVRETNTLPCGHSKLPWDMKTPSLDWIKKFWQFFYYSYSKEIERVNGELRDQVLPHIQMIGNLPLFPVNDNQYLVTSDYLKQLVNRESFVKIPDLWKTLEKIKVMMLTRTTLERSDNKPDAITLYALVISMLPDFEHPEEIVTCLHLNAEMVHNANLSENEVIGLLRYFSDTDVVSRSWGRDIETQLKDLPLFVTHFDEIVALTKYDEIYLAPVDIPSDGLKEMAQNSNIIFLKNVDVYMFKLYERIGIKTESVVDIYVKYIIPKYKEMDRLAFYKHVEFLAKKDEYAKNIHIMDALRSTPFIFDGSQSLKVQYVFDPDYELFNAMCDDKELVPVPLRKPKTLQLLRRIGLQSTLTIALLERFTKSIATVSQREEDLQTAIHNSTVLLKSLLRMPDFFFETDFSSINNIKFIKPLEISNELSMIHPQYNPDSFICFRDSIVPDKASVCWSSSHLLPECVNVSHRQIILDKLEIRKMPTFFQLRCHCKNIGKSTKQRGKTFSHDCLQSVMQQIYEHLDEVRQFQDNPDTDFMELCNIPLIYHKESKDLLTPKQIVMTCKENVEEIRPFITKCPVEYVHFQELFCLMGCWKEPNCDMYATVLTALKQHVDGSGQLLPKEMVDAVKAQGLLFKYLSELTTAAELDERNTFLLGENERIQSARSLVINNNNLFKQKIDADNSIQCSFVFPLDSLSDVRVDKNRVIESLKYLPERCMPHLLTSVAKFKVNLDRISTKEETPANDLNEFLHGRTFIHGYLRLVKHALKNNIESEKWNESLEKSMADKVSNITCKHVTNIEISLFFKHVEGHMIGKEVRVHNTERTQGVHIENKDSVNTIYFDTTDKSWFNQTRREIAVLLNKFAGDCLPAENFVLLMELIEHKDNPSAIPELLDQKAIDEYESTVEIKTYPLYPTPGTFVPEKWHQYLDNDYGVFHEYEFKFVALEIDDPAQTEDFEDEDTGPTYIFVHIIKKSENLADFALLQEYQINDGTETTITVPAYRLYKFIAKRSENSEQQLVLYSGPSTSSTNTYPNDIVAAFKEVREYLINAWKQQESIRKKLVLRLLKKWHPDKNPDNVQFCTKVFQYIQMCLKRLENGKGLPEDFPDSKTGSRNFSFSTPSSSSYWNSSWYGRYWKRYQYRSQRYRDYDHCDGFTNFGFSNFRFDEEPVPWKSEGRRWFKQAKSDLESARKAWERDNCITYNWICYLSHQASEKSLKAAWYAKDANKIHRVKYSHELGSLSCGLKGHIGTLACDVSSLTGIHTRMRYPDTLSRQELPCEAYTKETARLVIEKSESLLNAVYSEYIN